MRRLLTLCTSPRLQVWIAGSSLVLWFLLSPVTMTTGLASNLRWLTFASLFANVATCFGWWVSSLVNVRAERIDDRSAEYATMSHIEALEVQINETLTAAGIVEIHRHISALCAHLGIEVEVAEL